MIVTLGRMIGDVLGSEYDVRDGDISKKHYRLIGDVWYPCMVGTYKYGVTFQYTVYSCHRDLLLFLESRIDGLNTVLIENIGPDCRLDVEGMTVRYDAKGKRHDRLR